MDFAVIKTGGKQYLVKKNDTLLVEKLELEPGQVISFDTLLKTDADGTKATFGAPFLDQAVKGKVVEHSRSAKVSVMKYKRKLRYRKNRGHRQHQTEVSIDSL